ncbi:hypothetical protein A5819_001847 [Enterococcus sp. 7E2_DIV0204]|uniref:Uncharacterized protein n=1 Tax=Candidatus Enterococcus lemimoniae TaxID=1834167 RepID=A0ABZ2T5B3_9ENTE|nr:MULTISPECIES: hypothetical protein [unclassified Enterococcus]OTN89355.1 hypothetical protein A5819_001847 [Enterococcus sp. 7E2_DIV0204]OTO68202.1 hypothetical protein A5866_000397 [Enterococcus sp. 12C11_DIV0727]OTP51809.1 hypothetical protein A5884_001004 [Enterococcus sp. 7D2_DIV0200]
MGKSQESNTIAYQEILAIKASLRELKSWHEALHFMRHFLDGKKIRTSEEMQACAEMFEVVYQKFGALLTESEVSLRKIVKQNK